VRTLESLRTTYTAKPSSDGLYDIEKKVNPGDAGDLWTAGMSIGPGSTGKYPNTDSIQGGVVTQTGLTISVLLVDSSQLTFQVSGVVATIPVTAPPTAAPGIPTGTQPPQLTPVLTPTLVTPSSSAPTAAVAIPPTSSVPLPTTMTPVAAGLPTTLAPVVAPVEASGPTTYPAPTEDPEPPTLQADPITSDGGDTDAPRNTTGSNALNSTSSAVDVLPQKLLLLLLVLASSYALL
jgi:hypothetical protein